MTGSYIVPLVSVLLILYGSEILAEVEGQPISYGNAREFLNIDDSDPKAILMSENGVEGVMKYAGVFGGNENDYPQILAPYDSSLQAHIRVKRLTE